MTEESDRAPALSTDNTSRQPTLTEGLRAVADSHALGEAQVSRADVRWDAAGNCYYRVWYPGDDDHEVGFIAP